MPAKQTRQANLNLSTGRALDTLGHINNIPQLKITQAKRKCLFVVT